MNSGDAVLRSFFGCEDAIRKDNTGKRKGINLLGIYKHKSTVLFSQQSIASPTCGLKASIGKHKHGFMLSSS